MADRGRWREPTASLPLTWGTYRDRYVVGLTLIVCGAIHLQGANTYALAVLVIGVIAEIVGWSIMPARGWRRVLATIAGVLSSLIMLTGPAFAAVLVLAAFAWLLVRHRPARSYVVVLLPLVSGAVLSQAFHEYSAMPIVLSVSLAVLIGSAWLGRVIAASASASSPSQGAIG